MQPTPAPCCAKKHRDGSFLLYRWPLARMVETGSTPQPDGTLRCTASVRQPALELRWTRDGDMVTRFIGHDPELIEDMTCDSDC